jgi:hypothetical protein
MATHTKAKEATSYNGDGTDEINLAMSISYTFDIQATHIPDLIHGCGVVPC